MYKTNISEKLVSLNMSIVTSTHQLTLSLTVTQVECSILKYHSKVIKLRFKITLAGTEAAQKISDRLWKYNIHYLIKENKDQYPVEKRWDLHDWFIGRK